jgi:hypothetical protein
MKKPSFPIWAIVALVVLVGGLIAVSSMSNKNIQTFSEHDHDHDGKSDHGDNEHR